MATTRNKVMWQEGMLMRPHHFQQQQRYNDYLDNQRFRAMNDLSWGFTELTLNNELLAQGKIMIDSASGTLPDGTVFSIPDQDALPDPLHPQHFPDERSRNIYLALPVASDVRNEISDGRRIGRYRLNYADVRDLHSEEGDTRTLTLGQLTPRIMSGAEDMSAYITLPLCRISDRHADGSLTLDDDFIPSCQNIQVSKKLRVYLKEVQGAIGGRASDLANRIGSPAQSGIADVAEFMMLQLLNRNQTRFTGLLFNDHTPFISEQTKQWLAASPDAKVAPVAQIGEESKAARACFAERGLEAALRYLDMLPEGDPRDQFHRQYLAAQLTEEAGLVQLAQQQYRMLFRMGLQMMVADWEPSLLEQLEQKFTAEQ